ncbi:MAG: CpXC domain-containing protein [Gammaproteobacteria bacterium]
MSLFEQQEVTCPACGTPQQVEIAFTLNATRRPDLRDAILERSYQRFACENCGQVFRPEPHLAYLDIRRNQWILAKAVTDVAQWSDFEAAARVLFDDNYGDKASEAAQAVGDTLTVRVVFGWSALREKLLIEAAGLDDVTVEYVKVLLLRALDETPLADDAELRFESLGDDDVLRFVWYVGASETPVEEVEVSRALYDLAVNDPEPWRALRETLSAGPFVDMNRLLVPEEAAAA